MFKRLFYNVYSWVIIVAILVLVFINQHYHIVAYNCTVTSESASFRLMTYNAYGAYGDYGNEAVVNRFLAAIDSIHPDVLALQEMHYGQAPMLCEGLRKRYPYNAIHELNVRRTGDRDIACLFSRYPIRSIYQLKEEAQQVDSIYNKYAVPKEARDWGKQEIFNVVLDIEGKDVLLVCSYLKTNNVPRFQKRGFKGFKEVLQKSLEGYQVGSEIRHLDAQLIRDSIEHYHLPTIVCGDMNDFESSKTVQTILGNDLKDVWWESGKGYGMTYYRHHLKIRIDHILTSEEIEAVSVDIPHLPFSDHYPLVADLRFTN